MTDKDKTQITHPTDAHFDPVDSRDATFTPIANEIPAQKEHLVKMGREMGEAIAAPLKNLLANMLPQIRALGMGMQGLGPGGEGITAASTPNAGKVHIEPGEGKETMSWAGRAAVKLSEMQERMESYGTKQPEWMGSLASLAKMSSFAAGDKHTFGQKLQERLRNNEQKGFAERVAANLGQTQTTAVNGQPTVSAGPGISPGMGAGTLPPRGGVPTTLWVPPTNPASTGSMVGAVASGSGGAGRQTGLGGGGGIGEALIRAIERLTEKIDRLIAKDMSGDESSTVANKTATPMTTMQQQSPQRQTRIVGGSRATEIRRPPNPQAISDMIASVGS